MKKLITGLLLASVGFSACEKLEQVPQSTASQAAVFGNENGLKLYTNSFYGMGFLPGNSISLDAMSDYLAVGLFLILSGKAGLPPTIVQDGLGQI